MVIHLDVFVPHHLLMLFSLNEQAQKQGMPENLQMMSIKQEPVDWSDFEHETANVNKSSIEVAVKPELIYSKGDTDEEGIEIDL